ncbi:MAG: Ig-like domain-containing protein [Desulfuromonadales bacterium]|nr:Ig-like domain-containing protein [Desulfuromonadales bacterium]
MKRFFAINISLFAMLSLLLLSACGGGGGGDGDTSSGSGDSVATVTTLSGIIADGYLQNARVFLDRNRDRIYNNGEPTAQSTAGGVYTLTVNPGEGELYPIVVQVVANQTIDEDDGMTVSNDYFLESLPGHWEFISPLTTMVALERAKNPSLSEQQIEIEVRAKLGVPDAISFYADYIAAAGGADGLVVEGQRAHRIAQVVAGIMGNVQHVIAAIPGAPEPSVVAFMVSDQVLAQAGLIRGALDDGVDVAALIATIVNDIDISSLDAALLTRYLQRIAEDSEVWDMQPPQLQSQSPAAGDTASVDAVITVTFDESLDEGLVRDDLIEVLGPNGLIAGIVNYDAENFRLTFTPSQLLLPFSSYQVVVREALTDVLGNPLSADVEWTFTTIFDQLPPPLPVF